mmetsp:Transcript_17693/g.24864  ORF Transcript_17693/g.24864 Transcript_17693/m.24864 type:complete len:377 (-) Transcript_17693:82-1212(-)
MGKNTKLPKPMKRPSGGGQREEDGWRTNSQDEVNKHIYDLMVASKRQRSGIDQFKEENKKEIDALTGQEGTEEELQQYRRQLDADRKKSLKEAKRLKKEQEKAAKKKRKRSNSDSNSDSDSDRKKSKKKKKKRSRRDSSDSDSSSSDSDDEKKKKKKSKSRKKDKDKEKKKKRKKDKDKSKNKDKDKDRDEESTKAADKPKDAPVVIDPVREAPGTIICVLRNNFGMVEKKILKTGTGRKPNRGNTVKVHYVMYLQSGMKKIVSSKDKYAKPYEFIVGVENVIKGWDEGVLSMRLGEKARLTVSQKFGYGMKGNPELGIPATADLVIDVNVLELSDDIQLPTPEEIAKRKIANKTVFIDRTGDRPSFSREMGRPNF